MSIRFSCPCGKTLRAPQTAVGRSARCPQCGSIQKIPAPPPPEPIVDETAGLDEDLGLIPLAAGPSHRESFDEPEFDAMPKPGPLPKGFGAVQILPPEEPVRTHRFRYWLLLLVLLPLAWSTMQSREGTRIHDRLKATVHLHPEVLPKLADLPEHATLSQTLALFPGDKLEGALLPHDTWTHWGFAAISGICFLTVALLLFPRGNAKVKHLVTVSVFTGTIGILLLLAFQWIAFHMPLFRGHGWLTLVLDAIWLIGQSYRMALGSHGFWLSFLGFTAGVGFCEELCKALPLLFMVNTPIGLVSWRTALMWGLISGVGFGVSEGITYSSDYYNGISPASMYVVRFVSCVGLHAIWTASVGIMIYRRREATAALNSFLDWLAYLLSVAIVPMILHGLYDTLLKQDYHAYALLVAVLSFGWLALQIELAKKQLNEEDDEPAYA